MKDDEELLEEEEEIELPENEEELVYVLNSKTEKPKEVPNEEVKDNRNAFFAWGSFLGSSGTSEKVKFIS